MTEPDANLNANDAELQALEAKIHALLPPRYADCFEEVPPTSMGSAALRYDAQGRVVWGEIWTTFCHLALAGGPPHRGRLLGPVDLAEIQAAPQQQREVVAELNRAMKLCADLPLSSECQPGWIGLRCADEATAAWLVRAIVCENVIARHEGATLWVPAGPSFRIEKEIKNVVVCVAKTCHYLFDHLDADRKPTGAARPLVCPPLPAEIAAAPNRYELALVRLQHQIREVTGFATQPSTAPGWVGMECGHEAAAVWLLRAIAVEDILVRREATVLYLPVDLSDDVDRLAHTTRAVQQAQRLWQHRSALA